jgi:ATP-binding cassette subfamily F protein 3
LLQEPTKASKPKDDAKAAREEARAASKPAKRKRKYPYRKVEELEAEIAVEETRLKGLEAALASPDLYRVGGKVQETTQAFEDAKVKLKHLYEHWEEAVELNG